MWRGGAGIGQVGWILQVGGDGYRWVVLGHVGPGKVGGQVGLAMSRGGADGWVCIWGGE